MKSFLNASIKRKLIAIQVLTTFTVLVISFAVFAFHDVKFFSQYVMEELVSTARLLSSNSASAVAFMDKDAAGDVLGSLDFEADIVNAWIYDNGGNLFAAYSKKGWEDFSFPRADTSAPKVMECYVTRTKGVRESGMIISRSVISGDAAVGMLSLRLNTRNLERLFMQGAILVVVVLVIGMAMAFGLATLTQRGISRPVLRLAEAGRKVTESGDYSIRVEKEGEDEIGTLYDSFNNVMEQVQVRERERDKALTSVKESEKKYRTLFDNMNDGFAYHQAILDGEGNPADYVFLEVNAAFEKFTGLRSRDITGRKVTEVIPGIEKADPDLIRIYGNVAKIGENASFEMYFKPFRKWYAVSAYSPEKGFFCAIFRDITEAKKAEALARQHQEKLIHTDKMTTLGILVSGVAHEINNPNNFMLLNSNNLSDIWRDLRPLLDKYREQKGEFMIAGLPYSEARNDVDMLISGIAEGAGRIRKIVESLKDFARKDPGTMDQRVDVNKIIESSLIIMSNLIKKSTDHLRVNYDNSLPAIKGNAQQIEQVIINLISNACQALGDKDKAVEITSAHDEKTKEIIVTIKDEGQGISSENMKHIMDPFFTTKRDSGGTGLGLSISYTIIKDHGGELKLESEPEKGTTAVIRLGYL